MPVPSSIRDLSTVPGSNSPPGSEAVGTSLDDYLRTIQSFIRNFWAIGADVAAAATIDLNAFDTEAVRVTGAATVTSLGTCPAGFRRELRFAGVCTLTHSSALILPGAVNITTAADDVCTFRSLGSGNWILVSRTTASASTPDISDSRGNVRDIPQNLRNASYTFALVDRGQHVMKNDAFAYTWTIPTDASVAFPVGTAITLVNDGSAGTVSVSPAGGVTLLDGTTSGAVTLAVASARTLLKIGANRWRVL